jgi:hypothetical protein
MGLGQTRRAAIMNAELASTHYLTLHTAAPGADGQSGNEATGTGYAATEVESTDWAAATAANPSVKLNDEIVEVTAAAGGTWSGGANMTHFALWNHASNRAAANFIGWGPLTVPMPVIVGNPVSFPVGTLAMSLADSDL